MSDNPPSEPPSGTKRVYWRPDADMTDEEIDAWAEAFVQAVLSNSEDPGEPPQAPEMMDT